MKLHTLVWREIFERKNQLATSFLAILLGVSVIVAMKNITFYSEKAAGRLCGQAGFSGERLEPDAAWIACDVPKHAIRLLHLHFRRVSQRLNVAARHEYK